jgi:hypothetical protein
MDAVTVPGILASDQVSEGWDVQLVANDSHEQWFDPWLTVIHPKADALVADIMGHYADDLWPARRRRPTDAEKANIEAAVRMIVANLALAGLRTPGGSPVVVSRQALSSKRTRYESRLMTTVHGVLEQISTTFQNGTAISLRISRERGRASTMSAGPRIISSLAATREADFAHTPGREIALLRYRAKATRGRPPPAVLIDYPETDHTRSLRADVRRINDTFRHADIALRGDASGRPKGPPPQLYRSFAAPSTTDTRFDLGGRLFGGWWQSLPKSRRNDLRINGEPIADLDFSSMFLRLAYLEAGAKPPSGDLYANVRDLEDPRWREGVKRIAAALLFRTSPLHRLPIGMDGMVPPGMTGSDVRERLLERHPTLATVFETGCGLRLMFRESEILMAALLALADREIAALPMHDGLMVAASKAGEAKDAMSAASRAVVGMELPIALKRLAE